MNRTVIAPTILAICSSVLAQPAANQETGMPNEPGVQPPTLIPREILFGNPERTQLRLSPDGAKLAFLAPVEGVLNVWVGPADNPDAAEPVTDDRGRGIRQYFWAFNNDHILYLQDKGGDENWKIYSVDVSTRQARDLTPFETIPGPDGQPITDPTGRALRPAARVQAVSERRPDQILVAINNRLPQLHDVYLVDLPTGELTKVIENNEGFAGYVTDDDFNIRLAVRMTPDGGSEILRAVEAEGGQIAFEPWQTVGMEDALTTSPVGFDKTGQTLYMTDSRGRDTGALTAVNLETGGSTIIAADPRTDVADVMVHPTEKNIQAVAFNHEKTTWRVLDDAIKPDLEHLRTVSEGEIQVTSRTLDDRRWTVAYLLDNGPVRYYLYEREPGSGRPGRATYLFSNNSKLEGLPLARMHPVVIEARDGLSLVSYLSLPPASDPDADARPAEPLPMVLLVHGGPWARDTWGYNPMHQWLANRGYAVLSVNFRGSTGFGKSFVNAANKEWAGKMHDDLVDAVRWAVDQRIADPEKVAIMGGSYGGYATLVGLTFTPDLFAAGVDIVGPSNIVTLLESIPPYWTPMVSMFTSRVGDHTTEEGRAFLESRSPLNYVDRIQRPLLIGQGANDPRVKQAESDQIVAAMQAKGIPVTYVLYPDEGHGFARPENRMSFFAVSEAFLGEHLGGRIEPVGDDLAGSSIQVPAGAEQVPGLSEAISNAPAAPKK